MRKILLVLSISLSFYGISIFAEDNSFYPDSPTLNPQLERPTIEVDDITICSPNDPRPECQNPGRTKNSLLNIVQPSHSITTHRSHVDTENDDNCNNALTSAQNACNGTSILNSPGGAQLNMQLQALRASMEQQKESGDIASACGTAAQLASISGKLNSGVANQCSQSVQACMSICLSSSSQYSQCQNLNTAAQLAALQVRENQKDYTQSQDCQNIALGGCTGVDAYSNSNCPQYCLAPSHQNLAECQKANTMAMRQLAPPSTVPGTIEPNPSSNSNASKVLRDLRAQGYSDDSTARLAQTGEGSLETQVPTSPQAPITNTASSTPTMTDSRTNPNSGQNQSPKTGQAGITKANFNPTIDGSSGGGGSIRASRGYAGSDTSTKGFWDTLKSFLPESEEEKMNKGAAEYNRKVLARLDTKHRFYDENGELIVHPQNGNSRNAIQTPNGDRSIASLEPNEAGAISTTGKTLILAIIILFISGSAFYLYKKDLL